MKEILNCESGCCNINYTKEKSEYVHFRDRDVSYNTAGIALIYNKSILLTQSYNNLWGVPKGKQEENETLQECALRELKEETGISFTNDIFNQLYKIYILTIHYHTMYIYIIKLNKKVFYNTSNIYPDCTGCGWINLSCIIKTLPINTLTKRFLKFLKKNGF
ncbi:hypothetical protein AGMMS49579_03770 [Spirochaetia bacterium]|nr:hypothetical protein AGMMS49579_03770 [Spirochaetia bacterium]